LLGGVCPLPNEEISKDVGKAAEKMKQVRRGTKSNSYMSENSDNDSMFQKLNYSSSGWSQSQNSMAKSVVTVDSGNVSHAMRKMNRIEADAARKRNVIKIQDAQGRTVKKKVKQEKMSKVQTFFALCKCYCAINVLLTPKAFRNGGYLFTPICLFVAASL